MAKYLGSHVRMKEPDYILGSIKEALEYKATACMLYTGPPRNKIRKPIEMLKISEAKALLEEEEWSFDQVIVHAPYIINLANTFKEDIIESSMALLESEIQRTAAIGSHILILHPGAHLGAGVEKGIEAITAHLNEIFEKDHSPVIVALEMMAGKGSEIGRNVDEIAAIIDGIEKKERVGVCLDTCHVHDAGYDLSDFDSLLEEIEQKIGLDKLVCLHINNSKNECGARKDRHANIEEGTIPIEQFARIVHHPKLQEIVMILETPFKDEKAIYDQEIALLRSLAPENKN